MEVTDPTHPLFGRRFPRLSRSTSAHSPGHVLVAYRQEMVLRLPLQATHLTGPRPTVPITLTWQALTELGV